MPKQILVENRKSMNRISAECGVRPLGLAMATANEILARWAIVRGDTQKAGLLIDDAVNELQLDQLALR